MADRIEIIYKAIDQMAKVHQRSSVAVLGTSMKKSKYGKKKSKKRK